MASLGEIDKHGREQTGLKATKRIVEKAALRPGEGRGRTERVCDVVRAMLVAKDMRTVGAIAEALRALQANPMKRREEWYDAVRSCRRRPAAATAAHRRARRPARARSPAASRRAAPGAPLPGPGTRPRARSPQSIWARTAST